MYPAQRIKNGKQRFAVLIGYLGVLFMVAIFFAPLIPNGSSHESAFSQILNLNFGGDYFVKTETTTVHGLLGSTTVTTRNPSNDFFYTFINLFVIAMIIIVIIMVPVNIKYLGKRLPMIKKKFGFESEDNYLKRLILFENEWYYRNLFGLNTIACLRWCAAPLCAYTFLLMFCALGAEILNENYEAIIRPIITAAIFIFAFPPENIVLAKEKKMIIDQNKIYDLSSLTFRDRTADELVSQRNSLYRALNKVPASDNSPQEHIAIQNDTTQNVNPISSNLEKDSIQLLKEYKDLLDAGIISQEEFDAKKQELLNTPETK